LQKKIIFPVLLSFLLLCSCSNSPTVQNTDSTVVKKEKQNNTNIDKEKSENSNTEIEENSTKNTDKPANNPGINDNATVNNPTVTTTYKAANQGVPVIMYHSIAYEEGNPARLPVENFKAQMQYLKDNNYTTLTLDELYKYYTEDYPIPEKSVVLTFDDGYDDNYTSAYPILKQFGFKATIFLISDFIDKMPGYLNSTQVKELNANGMSIECHTVDHPHLDQLTVDQQKLELENSKQAIEKLLNKQVKYIAYPYGGYNQDTLSLVSQLGYSLAFTTDGRWSEKSDGLVTLDRVYISGFAPLEKFITRITDPNYDNTD